MEVTKQESETLEMISLGFVVGHNLKKPEELRRPSYLNSIVVWGLSYDEAIKAIDSCDSEGIFCPAKVLPMTGQHFSEYMEQDKAKIVRVSYGLRLENSLICDLDDGEEFTDRIDLMFHEFAALGKPRKLEQIITVTYKSADMNNKSYQMKGGGSR